ncbi:MAG: hypothetical protein E7407_03000 [Ruminococcaceae bacterium]|nr:hypothetical protein [Oscillospiraceae bacterium]
MPYDKDEFDVYYKVKVRADDEDKYVFNKRTLVGDIESAKIFQTMRSLKRCMSMSEYEEYEVIKFLRK